MFSTAETFAPRFATIATMQYNHIDKAVHVRRENRLYLPHVEYDIF